MRRIEGAPRHLSIHSGGMLITALPLDSIVPLEPATMPGRVIAQWDKDSVEDAGLIKIDLLGLRTLGLIAEAQRHAEAISGAPLPNLDALPFDDPALYALMHTGDTIGTFQVESRAQVQMSVRMQPRTFEEIAVEIAIVRPGPIQGGAVHPYLRRRAGLEPVTYLHPSLEPVLRDTLGVLLYQEQSIRVAVAAAGFTPGEADLLRRAMSRSRSEEAMAQVRVRFMAGAQRQGIDEATASAIFQQLAGFAGYGFCKSHATSFALITWQTLWLKHYHPVAFYCALFNQQPMGFYSPEVVAGDARRHTIAILPPDVSRSQWLYTPERRARGQWALRMGLATVTGLGEAAWQQIEAARMASPFTGLADFARRTGLDRDTLATLIRAGACDLWGERRPLLWALGELETRADVLKMAQEPTDVALPALPPLEQSGWEHELLGLAPGGQIMRHYRDALRERRVCATWEAKQMAAGRRVRVAGLMAVRQRPPTAGGILFISLEDEAGLLDLVVKPEVYARLRDVFRGEVLIVTEGIVQRTGRAVSVLVSHAAPLTVRI
jgi:error-prone DNA polymerase